MTKAPEPPDDIEAMIAETERRLSALDQERAATAMPKTRSIGRAV